MTALYSKPRDWPLTLVWIVALAVAGLPAIGLSWFVATYEHAYDFLRCPQVERAWMLAFGLAAIGLGPAIIVLLLGLKLHVAWVRPVVAALCLGLVSILVGAYWMSQEPLSLHWQDREQCLQSGML